MTTRSVAAQIALYFTLGLCVGLVLTLWLDFSGQLTPASVVRYVQLGRAKPTGEPPIVKGEPTSHEELDRLPGGPDNPIEFHDGHMHHDDSSVADALTKRVRVLCWIMTQGPNHKKKAQHVKATWGQRCNKLIFMSDTDDPSLPAVNLNVSMGREHLTAKTMKAFDYVAAQFLNDYDWFIKADDDTYVIVENLRYMLSDHSPTEPVFFGHHFKVIVKQGYFSGGGGYVLSREALSRFASRTPKTCASDHGAEDVEMGRCMEKLGVKTGDSRDAMGRSRFHCLNPETHLQGGYPDWYLKYDKYGAPYGAANISDYAVTFHYISPEKMYALEFYVYHLRPFGIASGEQSLNIRPAR